MFEINFKEPALTVRLLSTRSEKEPLHAAALTEKIPFLGYDLVEHRSFLTAFDAHGTPVGVVSLVMDSRRIPGALGVGFVSTRSDFRNRGVSKALVNGLFELARSRQQAIANTHYEPEGLAWLKPVMHRAAALYPDVEFYERDQSPVHG